MKKLPSETHGENVESTPQRELEKHKLQEVATIVELRFIICFVLIDQRELSRKLLYNNYFIIYNDRYC